MDAQNPSTSIASAGTEAPQTFNFGNRAVRTIARDGEVWFVANDVCAVLELANPRNATARLDEDEKDAVHTTDTMGRPCELTIISESGLYSLVMSSRKGQAKDFKRWVTHEVLPSIRKTGGYQKQEHAVIPASAPGHQQVSAALGMAWAVAGAVQQDVSQAVLTGGDDWKHQRYLLSFITDSKHGSPPLIKKLSDDAVVASPDEIAQLVFQHTDPVFTAEQVLKIAQLSAMRMMCEVSAVKLNSEQERLKNQVRGLHESDLLEIAMQAWMEVSLRQTGKILGK